VIAITCVQDARRLALIPRQGIQRGQAWFIDIPSLLHRCRSLAGAVSFFLSCQVRLEALRFFSGLTLSVPVGEPYAPCRRRLRSGRYAPLAFDAAQRYFQPMTDKQAVIDALNRLPEVASLEEITEELHIMASIRRGRADIASERSKSHEEVEQIVDSWATAWTSR